MIIKFVALLLYVNAYDYWNVQYTSFTSNNLIDNEGWWVQGNNGQMTSYCNGVSLFGGYNVFGSGTIVSKYISLPPHFKLRVSLEFWKIDSWDHEFAYIFLDDYVQTGTWENSDGISMCGDSSHPHWGEAQTNYVMEFSHQNPSLIVIITSSLDQLSDDESWGFRNFKVEVILCSPGCLSCDDDKPEECLQYQLIEMNWLNNFNFDGWTLDNQQFLSKSLCANIWVVGGINQITGSQQLSKKFTSLVSHYKIILEVQVWKFDVWNNNQFQLEIDGQISAQAVLNQFEVFNLCGDIN